MSGHRPTALIAEDEPLLRASLMRLLAEAWPELQVVAQARGGREAVELFEEKRPDVCFLDVHMPGMSGVEAGRWIGRRAQLVFVTAFDEYAVEAFRQGAIDYLVKPVERERLTETVARLKERLEAPASAPDVGALLGRLAQRLDARASDAMPDRLRWIHASVGKTVRLVPVAEIDYFRSDEKYTLVAWRSPDGAAGEGLVRTPLKELLANLDPATFV
ncbi:MAG: response regulator transcription factor, partial [Thermoanaerobaculia bacterium]